ncbi:multidrug resistance-associated protein 1 [Pelomyxa schiedti]|nr:multidrug resistance-associated protein 1 [Pelomyxa schiedti]
MIKFPPAVYTTFCSVTGVVVWTAGALVLRKEREKFLPYNWILKSWWSLELFLTTLEFPSAVRTAQEVQVVDIDGWILWLFVLATELPLCISILWSQEASYYTAVPEDSTSASAGLDENSPLVPSVITPAEQKDPDAVNPFSYLTFHYVNSLLNLNNDSRHNLKISDISNLASCDTASVLSQKFEHLWADECAITSNPRLVRVLWKIFAFQFVFAGVLRLIYVILEFLPAVLIYWMILYMGSEEPYWKGLLCTGGFFLAGTLGVIVQHQYLYKTYRIGQNVRTCVVSSLYRKCLKLSHLTVTQVSIGTISNFLAVDSVALCDVVQNVHLLWISPVEIFVGIILLLWVIGVSSLAGVACIVLTIPVSLVYLRYIQKNKKEMMAQQDLRCRLLNEVLHAIKTVKLMIWEAHLHGQLNQARSREVSFLLKSIIWRSLMQTTSWSEYPMVILITFGTFIGVDSSNVLTATEAFVTFCIIFVVTFAIIKLPRYLAEVLQSLFAINRVTRFLLSPELDAENSTKLPLAEDKPAVLINGGEFQWEDTNTVALTNINFSVQPGQLVAVIGKVGSGKSTLLHSLLGEIKRVSGEVAIYGQIAYAAQHAWVQNLRLRDNILFGKPYFADLYDKVVNVCQLQQDILHMNGGDNAEIGEQGSNLSGGQKQRLSLARAVYQTGDIYLLDDTLSAVDANVGEKIFTDCICGILKEKTRIFVTQQFQYLNRVDRIFVMKNGTIVETGTFEELSTQENSEFSNLYSNYEASMVHSEEKVNSEIKGEGCGGVGDMTQPEGDAQGHVPFSVYLLYFKEAGIALMSFTFFLFVLSSVALMFNYFWIMEWAKASEEENPTFTDIQYFGILAGSVVVIIVLILARFLFLAKATTNVSASIHEKALKCVLQAPMVFFYSTPVGRLVNRFSEDLQILDDKTNFTLSLLISVGLMVLGIAGALITLNLYFIPFVFPLFYMWVFVQKWYLVYAQQLIRLDTMNRSPLHASLGETLYGLNTIRAMKDIERFILDYDKKLDTQQKAFYSVCVANRWLGFRIDFLGVAILSIAFFICAIQKNILSSSEAGLALLFASQLQNMLMSLTQYITEFVSQMVSLQRLQEYLHLPQEHPLLDTEAEQVPPDNWPEKGRVEFVGYSLQYRPTLPPALENISLSINAGEKIGVVGRTGAGKSSLMIGLFRLEEATQGKIEIDDIDISTISLHTLRSRLCVIPQDPVLFRGTLKKNLDMFERHSSDALWEALDAVNLRHTIEEKEGQLNCEVSEGGENFSVGERQLICLARGLLSKSKVMVLDEATANVDLSTEEKIHNVIFDKCGSSTMILIAHRTHTILHCDKVLMLERGKVLCYGPPQALMETNESFASLIKKSDFKE